MTQYQEFANKQLALRSNEKEEVTAALNHWRKTPIETFSGEAPQMEVGGQKLGSENFGAADEEKTGATTAFRANTQSGAGGERPSHNLPTLSPEAEERAKNAGGQVKWRETLIW